MEIKNICGFIIGLIIAIATTLVWSPISSTSGPPPIYTYLKGVDMQEDEVNGLENNSD